MLKCYLNNERMLALIYVIVDKDCSIVQLRYNIIIQAKLIKIEYNYKDNSISNCILSSFK
jgi:hypothetical protein